MAEDDAQSQSFRVTTTLTGRTRSDSTSGVVDMDMSGFGGGGSGKKADADEGMQTPTTANSDTDLRTPVQEISPVPASSDMDTNANANVNALDQLFSPTMSEGPLALGRRESDFGSAVKSKSKSGVGAASGSFSNNNNSNSNNANSKANTGSRSGPGDGIEEGEVEMDDDARFSNVPLTGTGPGSGDPRKSFAAGRVSGSSSPSSSMLERRSTVSFGRSSVGLASAASIRSGVVVNSSNSKGGPSDAISGSGAGGSKHRKSASAHTVGSGPRASEGGNLPFLLHRLDLQKSLEGDGGVGGEGKGGTDARRLSANGQQRLQEEFSRLQHGHQRRPSRADDENSIDWGMFLVHYSLVPYLSPPPL
jgi:hypothetical protein